MSTDNGELVRRLNELAHQWEECSESASTYPDWGPEVLAVCAYELKAVLDD